MVLLLGFALIAGAATAITPCVLPVLPALLSASSTGGRRRPLGVVAGLALTNTITIVGIASVVDGVGGLAGGTTRTLAICVLFVFGAVLLVPPAQHWVEARLAGLSRLGPRTKGEGFWSGLPVGGALGFVYAPCAGPILAAVISVSATQGVSVKLVLVGIAYALGSACVLLLLALGGRRIMDRVRRAGRGPGLQRAMGAVMVITAILMFSNLDIRFQTALANHFPNFLTNPTGGLERSNAVENRLADLRGRAKFDSSRPPANAAAPTGAHHSDLPVLGVAPDFAPGRWFNSKPLTIASLRGRVTLVDFWTYTCINCLRTLPYLKAWDARYRSKGLTIVGVHTPEFSFEHSAANVERAIAANGLRYPVVQDNDYATWTAYGNQYWPAHYLIDAQGRVRYTHFGEGDYDVTENAIRSLLEEAGAQKLGADARAHGVVTPGQDASPETYLGTARAQGWVPSEPAKGMHDYPEVPSDRLAQSAFSFGGTWRETAESARAAAGATIKARVVGKDVYLVLSSQGDKPRPVQVLLDGRPISARDAGTDVHGGKVTVVHQRLYNLVNLSTTQEHVLQLRFAPGVSGYAFTFG